jgi:hypothetical protein
MEHAITKWFIRMLLSVVGAAALFALDARPASAQSVHYWTSGIECRASTQSQAGSFSTNGPRLVRNSSDGGGVKWVVCPIKFDADTFATNFAVNPSVTRVSGTISCYLYQYDAAGAFIVGSDQASDTTSTGTSQFLYLDVSVDTNVEVMLLTCSLPEQASVNLYDGYSY